MGTIIDLAKPPLKMDLPENDDLRLRYDTEIIRLQNFDNFYSLMDRLNQKDASGQCASRIILVWPVRGRVLETPVEFGRLRGWSARHGYQVALVIPHDSVHLRMAQEQGLPAFSDIKEAEKNEWEIAKKTPPIREEFQRIRNLTLLRKDLEQTESPGTPAGIRILFFLLALGALAAAAFAIFPRARVDITPYLTRKTVNMTIWTDERLDTATMGGGIPTVEKKIILNLQTVIPASGQVRIEPGIAVGEVIIRNTCDRIYRANAGVELGTSEDIEDGIIFTTLDSIALEPGEERPVRIEASAGGSFGNLPAGSIRFAAYPQSLCWEIRQEKPTKSGNDGVFASPTDKDRTTARQNIENMIREAAAEALQNDPEGKDLLPLGDPVLTAVKQEQYFPEPGFASDTLTLRQTLEVTVRTVRRSDMEAIIRGQSARLNMQIPQLTGYEILSGPTEENGLTRWSIRADYLVYEPETNEEVLQIMLRGKTLAQARSILNTLEHVKSSSITLLPSGMKHMPLAAQNIRVTIHPAVEAEEPL